VVVVQGTGFAKVLTTSSNEVTGMKLFRYTVLLLILAAACEAKHVEAPIKPVEGANLRLEEGKAFTANLDKRVNDLIGGLAGLNSKIKLILKLTQKGDSGPEYTPLDFVLDMLSEAKRGIATKSGITFSKEGFFELPFLKEDNSCHVVVTTFTGATDVSNQISDAKITMKNPCMNGGADVQVASAHWEGDTLTLKLDTYDLQSLLTENSLSIVNQQLRDQTGCELTRDPNGQLNSSKCQNVVVRVNNSVVASLDHLNFAGSGAISFSGDGRLYENGTQKAMFSFQVPRDRDMTISDVTVIQRKGNP